MEEEKRNNVFTLCGRVVCQNRFPLDFALALAEEVLFDMIYQEKEQLYERLEIYAKKFNCLDRILNQDEKDFVTLSGIEEEIRLIQQEEGNIAAIQFYREQMGVDLREAKRFVDNLV